MEDLRKQAERFGADIRTGIATSADLSKRPYRITIDNEKGNRDRNGYHLYRSHCQIFRTGR